MDVSRFDSDLFTRLRHTQPIFMMLSRVKSSVHVRSVFNARRGLATSSAAEPATEGKFQDEWNNAKSYKDIPGPNVFVMIRNFLPGGNFKVRTCSINETVLL